MSNVTEVLPAAWKRSFMIASTSTAFDASLRHSRAHLTYRTIAMSMLKIIRISLPLLVLLPLIATAQRLTIASIDSSSYPIMRASVFMLDAAGNVMRGVSAGDIQLLENGAGRPVVNVTCPSDPSPVALSSVLTVDVSSSMASRGAGIAPNIDLARAAANAWVQGLPEGESECALSSFDDRGLINQDFTRDRTVLSGAIQSLRPQGGTNYNAGLQAPPAGALALAANGTEKRVVIFLTDGRGDGNENSIVAEASRINATIYCVTLGMPAPQVLKNIAHRTGGECYENVTTVEEAAGIYRAILYQAQGGKPCQISWQSEPSCAPLRQVEIAVPTKAIRASTSYQAPFAAITGIELLPASLTFGRVKPGESKQLTMKLRGTGAPVRVEGIEQFGRRSSFILADVTTPFVLGPGEERSVTVRFAPTDTAYDFARWTLKSNACSGTTISASGGAGGPKEPTIHLIRPNGGEKFQAGESVSIDWEGIPPNDSARIDYSTDNGSTWRTIATGASGLHYSWKVPATPSDRCLARVTQIAPIPGGEAKERPLSGHQDWILSSRFSPDGGRVVTASWDGTAKIWDVRSHALLKTIVASTGSNGGRARRVYYAEFSPDGSRILTASDGNVVQLWDAVSGRQLQTMTGRLYHKPDAQATLRDGESEPDPVFSSDGRHLLLLTDKLPTIWDAASGRKLHSLQGHHGWVNGAVFSPNGAMAVTAGEDSTARIWDVASGAQVHQLVGHNERVTSAQFSPDGAFVATASWDSTVRIWNVSSGEEVRRITVSKKMGGTILRALFSPDGGSILIWGGIDLVPTLYDIRTGAAKQEYAELENGRPYTSMPVGFATFSADATRVAILTGNEANVWDVATGKELSKFQWDSQMSWVDFSPDGSKLSSSMSKDLVLWNVEGMPMQEDRSDNVWSIIDSHPAAADVDFGRRAVRTVTDSVVTAFIRNSGTAPLRVEDIVVGGANAKEFSLVSGIPPFEIPAGGAHAVEFRFAPTGTGKRSASVAIDAGGRVLTQTLRGEGIQAQLRMDATSIDMGAVPVGDRRDSTVEVMLRNNGRSPLNVSALRLDGPDTLQFALAGEGGFVIPAGASHAVTVSFSPAHRGRTSSRIMVMHDGVGSPAVAELYGDGIGVDEEMPYHDPTTFRSIVVPNAIVPPKGSIIAGDYDGLGLLGGYVPVDHVMILAGGSFPLPDDWGGVHGTLYGSYSIGIKGGMTLLPKLDAAIGYQWGQSIYDREETADITDSRITVSVPYASISYGDDDSRISVTGGYAFKHHVTIEAGEFDRNALLVAGGWDYRFAKRWKVAAEAVTMQTLGFVPIAATLRFFGHHYAIDGGIGYTGLRTDDGSTTTPVLPVVSFLYVW